MVLTRRFFPNICLGAFLNYLGSCSWDIVSSIFFPLALISTMPMLVQELPIIEVSPCISSKSEGNISPMNRLWGFNYHALVGKMDSKVGILLCTYDFPIYYNHITLYKGERNADLLDLSILILGQSIKLHLFLDPLL